MGIEELNEADPAEFVTRLAGVWEHSPWIARRAADMRPFADAEALSRAMWGVVEDAGEEEKLGLLRAHPSLAGKLAREGALGPESTQEQSRLGLDRLPEEEFTRFTALNSAYEAHFEFPFIICVRNHTKESILAAFERRLEQSRSSEIRTALEEVRQIAQYRLHDRL